jgi:hypothetical protein
MRLTSYSYTPSFEKYYYDTYASQPQERSFRNTADLKMLFWQPLENNSNILGFDLSNTLRSKVRDSDSTK